MGDVTTALNSMGEHRLSEVSELRQNDGQRGPCLQERKALTMSERDIERFKARQRHWRSNLRVTAVLLVLWFVVTFVVTYYARELSFRFFGWPFSFWMAAQGSLVVYCLIVWFYARYMDRLDIRHGVQEPDE